MINYTYKTICNPTRNHRNILNIGIWYFYFRTLVKRIINTLFSKNHYCIIFQNQCTIYSSKFFHFKPPFISLIQRICIYLQLLYREHQ